MARRLAADDAIRRQRVASLEACDGRDKGGGVGRRVGRFAIPRRCAQVTQCNEHPAQGVVIRQWLAGPDRQRRETQRRKRRVRGERTVPRKRRLERGIPGIPRLGRGDHGGRIVSAAHRERELREIEVRVRFGNGQAQQAGVNSPAVQVSEQPHDGARERQVEPRESGGVRRAATSERHHFCA